MVGRQQDVDVVEDPVGLGADLLGLPERPATTPGPPSAEAVGLTGAPLEPLEVLHVVGLGADPGEELRHERRRRVGVAGVDLAHVVAQIGQQPRGVL